MSNNQIKHNSPSGILSPYNPITSLKPHIRKKVNEGFIQLILEAFFDKKGGLENFSALDPDKLQTEVEFNQNENFVQSYIYQEIIDEIKKENDGTVIFKPKYVITFDKDLASLKDDNFYPYQKIFKADIPDNAKILYGKICLGDEPILYYIWINLQRLIKFIKEEIKLPAEEKHEAPPPNAKTETETAQEKRERLFNTLIFEKQKELKEANEDKRTKLEEDIQKLEESSKQEVKGEGGKLRVTLEWKTTDDLDLHIVLPNQEEISYSKKVIEYNGVIGALDVDANAGSDITSNPQENIYFNPMPKGEHKIYVNFYNKREFDTVSFFVTVIPEDGEGKIYEKQIIYTAQKEKLLITTFEYKEEEKKLVFTS